MPLPCNFEDEAMLSDRVRHGPFPWSLVKPLRKMPWLLQVQAAHDPELWKHK
jgi:hypothetical protein